MNVWPDEALEQQMRKDAVHNAAESKLSCTCAHHIYDLLSRVRELEKREAELRGVLTNVADYAETDLSAFSDRGEALFESVLIKVYAAIKENTVERTA